MLSQTVWIEYHILIHFDTFPPGGSLRDLLFGHFHIPALHQLTELQKLFCRREEFSNEEDVDLMCPEVELSSGLVQLILLFFILVSDSNATYQKFQFALMQC